MTLARVVLLFAHALALSGVALASPCQETPVPTARLHGVLRDAELTRLPRATLLLHSIRLEGDERAWDRVAAASDAEGVAECEAPAGRWIVVAAEGGRVAGVDLGQVEAGALVEQDFVLRRPEAVEGIVLWPNGASGAKAKLTLRGPEIDVGAERVPSFSATVRADEDGSFRLERGQGPYRLQARSTVDWKIRRKMRRGWDVGLPPEALEHPAWRAEASLDDAPGFVLLVLDDAATVSCRVRTPDGAIPSELRVRAQAVGANEWSDAFHREPIDVRYTQVDDRFVLSGLHEGDWAFVVTVKGYASWPEVHVSVRDGRVVDAVEREVVLQRPAELSGRVVNASGEAVVGAQVAIRYLERGVEVVERNQHGDTTDLRGGFHLSGLDPGPVELTSWQGDAKTTSARLELEAGATKRDIELRLGGK